MVSAWIMRVVSAFKDLAFIVHTISFNFKYNITQIQLLICLERTQVKILQRQKIRPLFNNHAFYCVTVPVIELAEVDKFAAGEVL